MLIGESARSSNGCDVARTTDARTGGPEPKELKRMKRVLKHAASLVGDMSAYEPALSTRNEELSAAWRSAS